MEGMKGVEGVEGMEGVEGYDYPCVINEGLGGPGGRAAGVPLGWASLSGNIH